MVQVLCYTGRGFDTCWRPVNIATHMVVNQCGPTWDGPHTPIRFFTGDFV